VERPALGRGGAAHQQSAEAAALTAGSEQRVAVLTALAANVAIAVAKFGAAAITGSSAMLAEAFHSLADSVNEVLLLVGARRSLRPADKRHPFGHARYRYLYAFLVSLTVFWLGGVLAVVEGIVHVTSGETLVDPRWAFAVLAIAAVLEGWSLRTTLRVGRPSKGQLTWKRLIQVTRAPELIVVFLEDLGALIGIAVAAVGVALTTITGQGVWDAVASIAIGVLLATIGLVVNRETQSLLVGESARDEVVAAIHKAIAGTDGVDGVAELRTIHVGPEDLVVAAAVWVDPDRTATAIARSLSDAKGRVREATPFRTVISIEPRVHDRDSARAKTQGTDS
jgi:cation diffusion facilitator family transporter